MNTSGRLAADARAGLLDPGVTALLTPDLWTFWLTGVRGAERTIASTTELLDVRTGDWALDLAERWGIDPAVLPAVSPTGSHAGRTLAGGDRPDRRGRTGAGVPGRLARHGQRRRGGHVERRHRRRGVLRQLGPGRVHRRRAGPGRASPARRVHQRDLRRRPDPPAAQPVRAVAARVVPQRVGDRRDRASRRAELLAAAEALPEGGPVVDVGDPALRAPGDMPARLAALAGRDLSPARTVRCILDSLAAAFASSLATAADLTGVAMRRVHLLGGGSRVTTLARGTARATGLPVVAGPAEATSIGNLMVQAVAAGEFDSLESARGAVDHGSDGPVVLEPA